MNCFPRRADTRELRMGIESYCLAAIGKVYMRKKYTEHSSLQPTLLVLLHFCPTFIQPLTISTAFFHNSPSDLQGQEVTICTDALLGVPFMLFASDICSRNSAMEVGSAPMSRPTDTIGLRSIERIL